MIRILDIKTQDGILSALCCSNIHNEQTMEDLEKQGSKCLEINYIK
jgi:hypothetical protein